LDCKCGKKEYEYKSDLLANYECKPTEATKEVGALFIQGLGTHRVKEDLKQKDRKPKNQ